MVTLLVREYRPEWIPRRGEWIAWASALLIGLAWLGLRLAGRPTPYTMAFLALTMMLAASLVSLSNWVDRQTVIRLDGSGIEFYSGLRHVRLAWGDVRHVRVRPSAWGNKVQVFGEQAYFSYRSLSEVWLGGELKGKMGFLKGEEILQELIHSSGLKLVGQEGDDSYYARP